MLDLTQNVSRRGFLKTASVAVAATALGTGTTPMRKTIPIATQMWVVRKQAATDLPGVLSSLSKIGYEGVEFADDYFGHSPAEIRKMLDDNGLRVAGNHIYLESMLGDKLPATIELHQTLGANNLIVRSLKKEQYNSREAVVNFAMQLNQIASRLERHGMRVGFHNHAEIFNRYGGEMAWNILADNTRPDVILQMDTGNAMHAPVKVDVVELLRRNAGRTITTHIKPWSKANESAYLGDDQLDWKSIINLMETTAGTEWYIIEYEVEGTPPLEALEANLQRFKQLRAEA